MLSFTSSIDPSHVNDEKAIVNKISSELPEILPNRTYSNQQQNEISLLSVLDDKNKMISCLKKQLQNQKMQLTYYIQRELNKSKIEELSESCTPQASEESLSLNLAINKFCRQSGIKTKLSLLHERMNQFGCKISNSLRDQELLLKKIVNKIFKAQDLERFGNCIDNMHINLFDKLLSATLDLRAQLDGFRICCDRVLIIEEERNIIVEQVYSLPIEERINRNYLLGIQMEKARLENEIKHISQHNATSRHRIKELNVIEKILHNLQWELNSSFLKNEESCISRMLEKINSEAHVLLETTKGQKRKFQCELSKTKCLDLNRVLLFINLASAAGKLGQNDFDRLGIKAEEEIKFFNMIKREIELIKNRAKKDAEFHFKKARTDYDLLKGKLSQVFLDNSKSKIANQSLQSELEELKLQQQEGIRKLQMERDIYKSQVEDLQTIREAYAQLVDRQPNTLQMEREFWQQLDEKDKKIFELEELVARQTEEIEDLRRQIEDQNGQISVLNRFINLTRPNSPKSEKPEENIVLNSGCRCLSEIKANGPLEPQTNNKDNNLETGENHKESKLNHTFSRYRRFGLRTRKYMKEPTKIGFPIKKKSFLQTPNYSNETEKLMSGSSETLSHSERESMSLIDIFSRKNRHERGETSDKIKGSSRFSIEIKYKKNNMENVLHKLDECEIFKDVSNESVVMGPRYRKMSRSLRYS